MKASSLLMFLLAGALSVPLVLRAQTQDAAPAPAPEPPSTTQLDSWLGPIALYPDPLLAQVLNAATKPSDVVLADQYLAAGGDPNQTDAQPWDPSVKALTHYPGVVKMMAGYLPWTTALGQLYLSDEPAVIDEIQHLRAEAIDWGNLASTPEENVIDEDGTIEIVPTEEDVIYVPEYDSDVVYAQPQGPGCITFGAPCSMGLWMNRDFDWHRHEVLIWDHIYQRPADWWSCRRPSPHATPHVSHHQHVEDTPQNARTRPSYFVLWRVPQVRVVGGSDSAAHGSQPGEFHQHHIEHLASPKTGGSSLVVLPNRGAMAAAHSGSGSGSFQVFSSSHPVHVNEVAGGHHTADTPGVIEIPHGGSQGHHRDAGTRDSGAQHQDSETHTTTVHHNSGESHTSGSAHTSTQTHSGSSSGRH